jgi:hypothetical protein
MSLRIPLVLFLLAFGSLGAQSLQLEFRDVESQAAVKVQVLNALGRSVIKGESAFISLSVEEGSYFQFISDRHFIKSLTVDWASIELGAKQVIYLQPLRIDLQEVEISAKAILFWDTLLVNDFEFLGENLLVLGDGQIVLSNLEGKVIKLLKNGYAFKRLEKDPRGNVFAFYQDSVIQIYYQGDRLFFYPAFPQEDYNTYIEPLSAVIGNSLVLRRASPILFPLPISEFRPGNRGKALGHPPYHNKGIEYIIYTKDAKPVLFYTSVDSVAMEAAQLAFFSYYGLAASLERFYDEYGYVDNERRFQLDILRKQYQNYYAKFIPFPIVKRFGSWWVFDHIKGVVQQIDSNTYVLGEAIPFSFPKKPSEDLILENEEGGQFYLQELKRGMVTIFPIRENWQLGSAIELGLFATELKISKETLFYISDKNYLISKSLKE